MKKQELQERINSIDWWHTIDLPYDEGGVISTPGKVGADHCSIGAITQRFGIPIDLSGKTVLDVGTFDGLMAFEAEKRGATVSAIDPLQGRGSIKESIGKYIVAHIQGDEAFRLVKSTLGSNVKYIVSDLESFVNGNLLYSQRGIITEDKFDIVFYFGVLYHVKSPLLELEYLSKVTKEYALIETAISPDFVMNDDVLPLWQFKPGFDNDPTNYWYPSIRGLEVSLISVGFTSIEVIYVHPDNTRATIKAIK